VAQFAATLFSICYQFIDGSTDGVKDKDATGWQGGSVKGVVFRIFSVRVFGGPPTNELPADGSVVGCERRNQEGMEATGRKKRALVNLG
jgi:hypothetical protein